MNKLKSLLIWVAFVLGTAAMTAGMFYALIDHKYASLQAGRGLMLSSVLFGLLFGTMGWAMFTVPEEITPNTGWRRWRPLMWLLGLAAGLEGGFLLIGKPFLWGDVTGALIVSLLVTFLGWSFGEMRAERARYVIKHKREEFLSSFSG